MVLRRRRLVRGRVARGGNRGLRFETLERRHLLSANPTVNEILASNDGVIQDEDGDTSDFIELYNPGDATAHLEGWYLTDSASTLTKWALPAVDLQPEEYLVIFASGKDRAVPGGVLHTNFSLSIEGEYLALVQPDGTTIAGGFVPNFPPQRQDISYGVSSVMGGAGEPLLRYFTEPTPGAANGAGVVDFAAPVAVSHEHGFYAEPFLLELNSSTEGTSIYYTYDGSIPAPDNSSATVYSTPILVDKSTVLRARAFRADYAPSPVTTQSYLFLGSVLSQAIDPNNPANNPFGLAYPAIWQGNAPADFNIDPAVVAQWDDNNSANDDFGIREALMSIPTMSIVMNHDDLWDASTGIYPNATSVGDAWRRAGSIEYVNPSSGQEFQYNVGVQMHGDTSRDNSRTKKHSFRLVFSGDYDGPGSLEFPLFAGSEFADFNTVVLKAAFTDSFTTRTVTNRYSPLEATYLRDVWMLDSQRAMGSLSPSATYVHLYVNGLYWGLYYPTERTDDASLAAHLGGDREDWDVIKDFNELFRGDAAAWNAMFSLARQMTGAAPATANALYYQLQGRNANGAPNNALPTYLDVDNLIDYLVLHFYAGADDWPDHNWVAARNRVNPGKGFQFFTWDQEISLNDRFPDLTDANDAYTPAELYSLLRNSAEFRLRFADRVQKQMLNEDGALNVDASRDRWIERADQIEAAIIGESARWGDARAGEVVDVPPTTTIPTMTVDRWRDSVADVMGYFPQSHALAISRFTADGLFTTLGAPQFAQLGGEVPIGYQLTLSKPAGSPGSARIYYTLDGSDPRLPGGNLSPAARLYSGAVALPTSDLIRVNARIRNGTTWSPLVETSFTMALPDGVVAFGGGAYLQDFDGLPTSGSQTLAGRGPHEINGVLGTTGLPGWTMSNFGGSSSNTEYRAQDGSLAGSGGRGVVSFGGNGSSDRSLGTLATSNQICRFGVSFYNTSGQTLTSFTLSYTGEQWRRGDVTTPNQLIFAYATNTTDINAATGFLDVSALTFSSPNLQSAPTNVALDGNNAANQTVMTLTVSGLNWAPGQTLTLRWTGQDASGQDDGLAIDNLLFVTDAAPAPVPDTVGDIVVLGSVGGEGKRSRVKVIDPTNDQTITTFTPYGNSFHGDVHVAVADLDRDGILEIITAPGAAEGRTPLVKVFDPAGNELVEFRISAYASSFAGGVYVATGDVDGDGYFDIVTSPGGEAAAEVRVWRNRLNKGDPYVADVFARNPYRSFLAFGATFTGGATVAADDVTGDGRAEIVAGNGPGMRPRVRVFDLTKFKQTAQPQLASFLREIRPFEASDRGGIFVAAGNVHGSGAQIIVGNGFNGRGEVEVYRGSGALLSQFTPYGDFGGNAAILNAPVHVARTSYDNSNRFEMLTAQGTGSSRTWRIWEYDAALLDESLEGDLDFINGFFVA